jgi:glycosyltransferase involved in cell wall biosynthesis
MEYMFFGLPIVAYDLAENRVSAGRAALYAEPNRERELARRIAKLLDDPARRRRMGWEGRERVRTVLAWEHSAPVLLAAYDRLWPAGGRVIDLEPPARPAPSRRAHRRARRRSHR